MGGNFSIGDICQYINTDVVVETGTYLCKRTLMFSQLFDKVYSIELSEDLYLRACETCKDIDNITLLHGDSENLLPVLCASIDESTTFYLDAHWFVDAQPVAKENPMPLLKELDAIKERKYADLIIVDDVHSYGRKLTDWGVPTKDLPEGLVVWEKINNSFLLDYVGHDRVLDHFNDLDKTFIYLDAT